MNPLNLVDAQWQGGHTGSPLFVALVGLSPQAQRAINLRFWENYTIEEIASQLSLSWDQVDKLIEISLLELRSRLGTVGALFTILEAS